jgi:hypothetical protein
VNGSELILRRSRPKADKISLYGYTMKNHLQHSEVSNENSRPPSTDTENSTRPDMPGLTRPDLGVVPGATKEVATHWRCRVNQFTPLEERFWTRVDKRSDAECWTWRGTTRAHGQRLPHQRYGVLNVNGRPTSAHRVSWELHHGRPIPDGLHIDHLCCNKLCVNPAHLEPVTAAENTRRWAATIKACPRGHEYNEANTYYAKDEKGSRSCRVCMREKARAKYDPVKKREMRLRRLAKLAKNDNASPALRAIAEEP